MRSTSCSELSLSASSFDCVSSYASRFVTRARSPSSDAAAGVVGDSGSCATANVLSSKTTSPQIAACEVHLMIWPPFNVPSAKKDNHVSWFSTVWHQPPDVTAQPVIDHA